MIAGTGWQAKRRVVYLSRRAAAGFLYLDDPKAFIGSQYGFSNERRDRVERLPPDVGHRAPGGRVAHHQQQVTDAPNPRAGTG
jgi:hypothetical protein